MANIEVSLSTLGLQQQQQRRKRNGMVSGSTTRSLHSSHLGGSSCGNRDRDRDLHYFKELEFFKQSLKDKEHLILK